MHALNFQVNALSKLWVENVLQSRDYTSNFLGGGVSHNNLSCYNFAFYFVKVFFLNKSILMF